jgi:WhiB family redox-sensing transcriptional regulator
VGAQRNGLVGRLNVEDVYAGLGGWVTRLAADKSKFSGNDRDKADKAIGRDPWPHERSVGEIGGLMDTSWMARGKCKELPPGIFFPSDGVGVDVARKICADCPVKSPCLEYALANHIDHGVWGGTSERERRRIARARRLAALSAKSTS